MVLLSSECDGHENVLYTGDDDVTSWRALSMLTVTRGDRLFGHRHSARSMIGCRREKIRWTGGEVRSPE